ncbi:DHS-like NAD/FAD-binding domain-containing protein [Spinellus fusiger]|nr:DHS-like NAD/FAD-binding domain-containing protein [Spinellus fusiger]
MSSITFYPLKYTRGQFRPNFSLQRNIQNIRSIHIKIPTLPVTSLEIETIKDHERATDLIKDLLQTSQGKLVVITGAGVSTDSGIPDYRGENGVYKRNPNHKPVFYQHFMASEDARQRYWARGYLGWTPMIHAQPNPTHYHLAWLLEQNYIQGIITQNVDNLHSKAGAREEALIELHGTIHRIECLACRSHSPRDQYQSRLHAHNPQWLSYQKELRRTDTKPKINPDGDVELPPNMSYNNFDIPPCTQCSSQLMKPRVVFFGENIQPEVTKAAESMVQQAKGVLIIGTSLATYSSYRLARMAKERGIPIGLVNIGPTRADTLVSWKIELGCTPLLDSVKSHLLLN